MKYINYLQNQTEAKRVRVYTPRNLQPMKDINRDSSLDRIETQKYQQLINHIVVRFPDLKKKVTHHFFLLNMFDDIRIDTITSQFVQIMQSCLKHFDEQAKQISQLDDQYKSQLEESAKTISEYTVLLKEKEIIKQSKLKVEERNQFVLKNLQMKKVIDMLNTNLKDIQEQDLVQKPALKQKIQLQHSLINDQQKVQLESDQLIADFEQQLHFAKRQEKIQINLIKDLQNKVSSLEDEIIKQNTKISILLESSNKYYELYHMIQEDYLSYKLMIKDKVNNMRQYQDIIKMIQKRVDQLTIKRSKEIQPPFISRTEYEEIYIARITKPLESDQKFHKYMMSTLTSESEKQQQDQIQNDISSELTKLRLNYPPFQSFLDKKTIDVMMFSIDNQKMSENFMGTLRAILDGMYKEMQKDNPISFSSYVYSWLSTFQIELHEVRLIPEWNKNLIQDYINKFYIQLMIPHFDKVWEIIQFRNFLNEVYSFEELYFYLHVRYLLKGIWIEQFDSLYEVVNYIKIDKAENIARLFLNKFSKQNQNMLIKSLQQAAIIVNNNTLVQTGYILQLLLEIFRVERNSRYKQLCVSFPSPPVSYIKFQRFMEKQQQQLSVGEVAELWREVYMISQGHPNVNAFFIASQTIILKQMNLPNILQEFTLEQLKQELTEFHGDGYKLLEKRMQSTMQENILKPMNLILYIKQYELTNSKERLLNFINLLLLEEENQQQIERMAKQEQYKAATQIQKFFKKKFLHNYLTLYSIIQLRLKSIQ